MLDISRSYHIGIYVVGKIEAIRNQNPWLFVRCIFILTLISDAAVPQGFHFGTVELRLAIHANIGVCSLDPVIQLLFT